MKHSKMVLNNCRKEIDLIDNQIISLLSKRMQLVEKVGQYKKERSLPPLDQKRWQEVLRSKLAKAEKLGLSKKLVKDIYERIHEHALEVEKIP